MQNLEPIGVFRPRAAVVSSVFAAMWLVAWWHQTHASLIALFAVTAAVSTVIGAALVQVRRFRRIELAATPEYRASRYRLYGWINAIYWPTVLAAVLALGASGHAQWINPAIILLVGLHLFPLGRVFEDWLLHLTGLLLVVFAVSYPAAVGPSSPIGLLGAGAILLGASAAAVVVAKNSFKAKLLRDST